MTEELEEHGEQIRKLNKAVFRLYLLFIALFLLHWGNIVGISHQMLDEEDRIAAIKCVCLKDSSISPPK